METWLMNVYKNFIPAGCLNVCSLFQYAPTTEAVYDSHPDALDIILNVLMVFREKGLVFAKSCILLAIIALDMHEKVSVSLFFFFFPFPVSLICNADPKSLTV